MTLPLPLTTLMTDRTQLGKASKLPTLENSNPTAVISTPGSLSISEAHETKQCLTRPCNVVIIAKIAAVVIASALNVNQLDTGSSLLVLMLVMRVLIVFNRRVGRLRILSKISVSPPRLYRNLSSNPTMNNTDLGFTPRVGMFLTAQPSSRLYRTASFLTGWRLTELDMVASKYP